ncbi:MAG: hypothetical protein AAGF23_11095, partial [Acidobacteriota bacterium]
PVLFSLWAYEFSEDGHWVDRWLALGSGVSPLVPLVLLSAVCAAWVVLALARLYAADHLNTPEEHKTPSSVLLAPFNGWGRLSVLTGIALVVPLAYLLAYYEQGSGWRLFWSLEGTAFDGIASVLALVALFLVIGSTIRSWQGWNALKSWNEDFLPYPRPNGEVNAATPRWFNGFLDDVEALKNRAEEKSFRIRRDLLLEAAAGLRSSHHSTPLREAIIQHLVAGSEHHAVSGFREETVDRPPDQVYQARQAFSDTLARVRDELGRAGIDPKRSPALRIEKRPSESERAMLGEQAAIGRRLERLPSEPSALTNGGESAAGLLNDRDPRLEPFRRYLAVELGLYVIRVVRHLRLLLSFVTVGSVGLLLAVASYPFEPQSVLLLFGTVGVVAGALFSALLLVRMEKEPILSWLAGTKGGEVAWKERPFFRKLLFHEGLPLLSVLATQIPVIPVTLLEWFQPLLKIVAP